MKKVLGIAFLAAFVGGAAAIGGYKLIERNQMGSSISDKQSVYFANNPLKVSSSAGTPDFVQAASAVSPAVVHIKTSYESRGGGRQSSSPFDMFEDFFGGRGQRMQQMPRSASGSGVILSEDGYIVTNNHVVENANKVEVVLTNKKRVVAKVIGTDPNTDLALLKIEERGLPVVKMGNSDQVQVGEWVLAVGYPLDLNTTVTAGIVSAKARQIGILGQKNMEDQLQNMTDEQYEEYRRTGKLPRSMGNTSIESFIQTDAAINPGNSGGALVNANGELVGINSAIASRTGYNQGYGFAIPINLARKILDDFMKYGSVKRGYLGVSFPTPENEEEILKEKGLTANDIKGIYVMDVAPNSGAAEAGVKAGDVIKKIDGKIISDSPDLQEHIGRLHPGDKVVLTLLRDGKTKDVKVTLKGESAVGIAANTAPKGSSVSQLGASFAPLTAVQKSKYRVKEGVVITNVEPGKAFEMYDVPKGLIITKINGMSVNNATEVEKALAQGKGRMVAIAGFTPDGSQININFPL